MSNMYSTQLEIKYTYSKIINIHITFIRFHKGELSSLWNCSFLEDKKECIYDMNNIMYKYGTQAIKLIKMVEHF